MSSGYYVVAFSIVILFAVVGAMSKDAVSEGFGWETTACGGCFIILLFMLKVWLIGHGIAHICQ